MKKTILKLTKSHLLKGSIIIFLGNAVTSFLSYLYHLITGRLLDPEQYGLLESFITLSYFLFIFTQAFSFAVINLISKTKRMPIRLLARLLEKEALKLSFLFWLLFLIFFPFLKNFLHLPNFLIFFIFSLQALFSFLPITYLSILQARLKFISFSLVTIFQSLTKNVAALILISAGLQTEGALISLVVAGLVSLLLGRFLIANFFGWHYKKLKIKLNSSFWRFSFLSLITNLGLTSIYSSDILMVRHYFPSYQSGIYSAVSVLGKIIFFAGTSVLLVAFPLFCRFKNKVKKLKPVFLLSFLFILFIGITGITGYKLFPQLIINLLYGKSYWQAGSLLPNFAVFISLFALLTLLVQLLLALESQLAAYLAGLTAAGQIFLIINRHNSLKIIIHNSIISVCFGLLLGLIFVIKTINEQKQ